MRKNSGYIPKAFGELDLILSGERPECIKKYMRARIHDKIKNQLFKCEGYTILELSIVMVVIALIMAAVGTASNMISNSKARSIVNELSTYNTAIVNFQNIYNYLPGDFPAAYSIWSSCGSSSSYCNGNGDGIITQTDGTSSTSNEGVKFWNHLYLASLITGYNSGYGTNGSMSINGNIPGSKYFPNKMGYFAQSNYLILAAIGTTNYSYDYAIVRNIDLYNIDLKIDDGVANSGIFQTTSGINPQSGGTSLTTGECPFSSTNGYDLANANKEYCRAMYYWQ